mmetsp:Transcript_9482/g.15324  ORF Transcript_9482/g.15324 Transcript_9482/m.15324 type:complete len:335 (+) Transcript_9482:119-1123(+)
MNRESIDGGRVDRDSKDDGPLVSKGATDSYEPDVDVDRLKAELEGLREALKVAMETAAGNADLKENPKKPKVFGAFTKAPILTIGHDNYFKSLKPCTLCDCSECCFPSIAFKTETDKTFSIKHGCNCLPCCFNFSYFDSTSKIGTYSLGTMCDAPFCGELVVDGNFFDANGERKFVLKHDSACGDCCKLSCAGCCNCLGCVQCYKYYCSDEQYRLYLQPIYRNDFDVAPIAHFKYVDRIQGPCLSDERISTTVEPCDELTVEEMEILSFYLVLTSNYVGHHELGLNWCRVASNSPHPYGLESIDTILGIHTKYLDEREAARANLVNVGSRPQMK